MNNFRWILVTSLCLISLFASQSNANPISVLLIRYEEDEVNGLSTHDLHEEIDSAFENSIKFLNGDSIVEFSEDAAIHSSPFFESAVTFDTILPESTSIQPSSLFENDISGQYVKSINDNLVERLLENSTVLNNSTLLENKNADTAGIAHIMENEESEEYRSHKNSFGKSVSVISPITDADEVVVRAQRQQFPGPPPSLPTESKPTITGGFHISNVNFTNNSRIVTVYWDKSYYCRHSFRATVFSHELFILSTSQIGAYGSHFRHIVPLSKVKIAVECVLEAEIENDIKTDSMVFTIPAQENVIEPPKMVTVSYGDGENKLFWKTQNKDVTNFTVYWLDTYESEWDSYKGIITYEYLPPNTTSYHWKYYDYQARAISVNSASSSSGIVWPLKTIAFDEVAALDSSPQYTTGADFIAISWSLCNPEIIEIFDYPTYNILYCSFNITSEKCTEDVKTKLVKSKETTLNVFLNNLRDNTLYKINVESIVSTDYIASHHGSSELRITTGTDAHTVFASQ